MNNIRQRIRNLETYSMIIFSPDLIVSNDLQLKLKKFIDYIEISDTSDNVKNSIQENEYDLIVLIISIELAESILKSTHDLKQLYQIYIYNPMNIVSPWINTYDKIQSVVINSDLLIESLEKNFNKLNNNEESFLKFDQLTLVNWYLQFIQLIINLNKENNDRQALIDYLKVYYANERTNLEIVLKFEREYTPSTAINWYTKDSFVYRILNKAFRSFDYQILILFRFFIVDLYEQLHHLYDEKNISKKMICYRGQIMYKNEMETLEVDQRICCTSFFSTTLNRDMALIFAGSSSSRLPTDNHRSVLFTIRPFYFNYKPLILADISKFSHFSDVEQEILFASGSCFRIAHIWFDNEINTWIIDLENSCVENKKDKTNRAFHIDIITIGFYLLIEDDHFQSVQTFYNILLKQANSFLWLISCNIGLGLIEYYKKNYLSALEIFQDILKLIDKENLSMTCDIIGNIYCLLGNIHRELNHYDKALDFYRKSTKTKEMIYFIEKDQCFWDMFIYKSKMNSFVKDDKYFYYCDRSLLNMALFYKRNEKYNLAKDTFQKVFNDFFEDDRTGKQEMFVKLLGYYEENSHIHDLIEKNRVFLDSETFSQQQQHALYAYEELGRHNLRYYCPDQAFVYYQEILQYDIEHDITLKLQCFDGFGRIYQMKEKYIQAIDWYKNAIACSTIHISTIDTYTIRTYEKILILFNEKLHESLLAINYMKELINNIIKSKDNLNVTYDLIASIYKLTVYYYHVYDQTKIELICNHIQEILNTIKINNKQWKKWLCIGSLCNMKKFQDNYHYCEPIIDENFNIYLKLYGKIFNILSDDTSDNCKRERNECEQFCRLLNIAQLDRLIASRKQ